MGTIASDQITISDLTDGYTIMLSMDAITLNGGVSTLDTAQSVTVNVTAYKGGGKVAPTIGTSTCPTNVSASVGSAVDSVVPVTITFAAALNAAGKVVIPVTVDDITINKEFAFSIAFKGATGAPGTAAYSYDLIVSHAAVSKSIAGVYNPTAITLTAKRLQGTGSPANYSGRFKVETTADNSTWTTRYTSSANEATCTYTIPAGVIAIRCSLYLAGGTTTLLDQQTVPIVSDGATGAAGQAGANGADAYTVVLTNESHTFAGGISAAIAGSTECQVIAFKGATQVAATIGTISGQPTGMTTSISNNSTTSAKFTVNVTTSMTTKNGVLTVPVTVDGKSFSKRFTYSLALTGATGATGAAGEDAILIAITTSNGNIFKNNTGSTILTAHVYKAEAELNSTQIAALGTLKWYKDNASTAVGTGASLTVSASGVASKAVYEVRLES